jgi:hypothetical protein
MRSKDELYADEQAAIKKRLWDMLPLDSNMSITLYDLEKNQELIDSITGLIPEIRTYFSMSKVTAICTPGRIKRPWISVMRHLTKDEYKMISADCRIVVDGISIRTKRYLFYIKN